MAIGCSTELLLFSTLGMAQIHSLSVDGLVDLLEKKIPGLEAAVCDIKVLEYERHDTLLLGTRG